MAVGTISAILGVLYALTQSDLKRLLAYSTIENAGIIVLGLGAGMMARAQGDDGLATIADRGEPRSRVESRGVQGAAVPRRRQRRDGDRHAGRSSSSADCCGGCRGPALFFLIGALAISGLPLLNGFISEWLTFQALLLGFASTPGLVRLNFPAGRRDSGALGGAGGGLFRQGVRHQLPRAAAELSGRRGARIADGDARAAGVSGVAVRGVGPLPGRRASRARQRAGVAAGTGRRGRTCWAADASA